MRELLRLIPLVCLVFTYAFADDWIYVVNKGDTVIQTTREYMADPNGWRRLQEYNQIDRDREIPIGTKIKIPVEWLKKEPAPVKVEYVSGNVRIKPAEGALQPLKTGVLIQGGETVLTGPKSSATLAMADGSKMTLSPQSRITFGALTSYGKTLMVDTEVRLEGGGIASKAVAQVSPAGRYRVVTPVATAGIRGSEFRVSLDEQAGIMRGEVLAGELAVNNDLGEIAVMPGFGTVARTGQVLEARPLLPAPTARDLPGTLRGTPLRFSWNPVEGAIAWRVQVAEDEAFERILLDDAFSEPVAEFSDALPEGEFHFRVRGVDADGLEGLDLVHRFAFRSRLPAPQIIGPVDAPRLIKAPIKLEWSGVEGATGYQLQLSQTQDFSDPSNLVARDTSLCLPPDMADGSYRWRVAAAEADGEPGAWSETRAFTLKRPPPAPQFIRVDGGEGRLFAEWPPGAPDLRYELEIARDPGFTDVLAHSVCEQNSFRFPGAAAGTYYLRVKSTDADGMSSLWSEARQATVPPYPPVLGAPADQALLRGAPVQFVWSDSAGAAAYRFLLTRPREAKPVVDLILSTTSHEIRDALEPGEYVWRVAGIDRRENSGGYAEKRFTLRPLPAPPRDIRVSLAGEEIRVTWQPVPNAAGYQVQMGLEPQFQHVLVSVTSDRPEARLRKPQSGTYYFRVRTQEAEDAYGPFSPAQVFALPRQPWWILPIMIVPVL
jgi:hypothetical protein